MLWSITSIHRSSKTAIYQMGEDISEVENHNLIIEGGGPYIWLQFIKEK